MTDTPEKQDEMAKAYEPGKAEEKWYKFWMDKGYFTPKIDKNKKPFVITMPPPNLTGSLHIGHALTAALEDLMIRWHRMKGEPTLWLPGVDHAAIAAQVVVERRVCALPWTRFLPGQYALLLKTFMIRDSSTAVNASLTGARVAARHYPTSKSTIKTSKDICGT
jgi:valyl-tRNA synthetase